MTDPTAAFFDRMRLEAPPVPAKYGGTVRFDVSSGNRTERWGLAFDRGRTWVFRDDREADCVVRVNRHLFEGLTSGRDGVYAAMLRNRISVEGDLRLLTAVRMLLPGPPGAHHPAARVRTSEGGPR
jgi:hypothetical protein